MAARLGYTGAISEDDTIQTQWPGVAPNTLGNNKTWTSYHSPGKEVKQ